MMLQSLIFRIAALIIAASVIFGAGYWRASSACKTAFDVAVLETKLATLELDSTVKGVLLAEAETRAATLKQSLTATEEKIDGFSSEITARSGRDACRLSDGDAERLRAIR